MIRYLASGYRNFVEQPLPIEERFNWEIHVVAEGEMAPVFPDRPEMPLKKRYVWVIPPGVAYGWRRGKNPPKRYVIHLTSVPNVLKQAVEDTGYFAREITESEVDQVDRIYRRLEKYAMNLSPIGELKLERAVIDLALLLLNGVKLERAVPIHKVDEQRVESVLIWYREHMNESPTIDAAAAVINLSAGHLRRTFQHVKGCSPHEAFITLRIERSKELLSSTSRDLQQIARQCGFSSDSDFCRVFSKYCGISPHKWRTNITRQDARG
ncbi:MAG: helix-turn-helix transcriptional regulator [Pontiellaceae bacterium]|nr:helix-turn-helix transcriptional regulator [Pontiellaceae bacterium]